MQLNAINRSQIRPIFAAAVFGLLCQATPIIASAEETNALLEEIVVTARKRAERLQDVPFSAAALSQEFIEDVGGVSSLRDITDLIVGISINETQAASLSEPTIRGAGQSRNRASVSATGLYRNGAYFATNSLGGKNFARLDTYDLERAEVLRGPQGALYGRNALGGAINLISKKPEDEFAIEVVGALGEKDFQRLEAKINIPINEQFGMRISHVDEERDEGFYTDVNGRDVDPEAFQHTRLSLRFQPTDALDINYVFDTQEENFTDRIRVRRSLVPDIEDAFKTTINSPVENTNDVDNHNLVLDWTLEGGTLTSVTNYREREIMTLRDGDFSGANARLNSRNLQTIQTADNDIFFQEIRYAAETSGNFTWLVGADYFAHENTEIINAWVAQTSANSQFRTTNIDSDSWAVFGSAEYAFENLPVTLTGEIRYAEDNFDGDVVTYRAKNQGGSVDPSNPINPQTDFATADTFTNLPWAVTAAYRFEGSDMLAYAKVASSYRHGGMNLNQGSPGLELFPAELTYDEETSMTYELGLKSTWFDKALTINAAVFITDYEDFLNTTTNGCSAQCQLLDAAGDGLGFNPDGSRIGEDAAGLPVAPNTEIPTAFFIDNVGEAEAWGYEVEATYRSEFDNGGTLLVNLGYAKGMGKVTSLAANVSDATRATSEDADLPYLRPNQVKGSFVYRQPLSFLSDIGTFAGATLVASATYTFEEGGAGNLTNVPCCSAASREQDTVRRLNARLGLETDNWSLFVRGDNLTDHSYETYSNFTLYRRNQPRFVYAEFAYRFQQ